MLNKNKQLWLIGLLPVLLAVGFNYNVLKNGLGWDDEMIIPNLQVPERWTTVFLKDRSKIPAGSGRAYYYRPLVSVSYIVDHRVWGDQPFGFHLTVLLFHALNTALVFLVVRSLLKYEKIIFPERNRPPPDENTLWVDREVEAPFLAAALFAVHPVHVEAVAWIAGRNDVICTTFVMASFLAFVRFKSTGGWGFLGFSMLAFFAALLTKEAAVGLILVFPFLDVISRRGDWINKKVFCDPRVLAGWIVPILILGVYFYLRKINLSFPLGSPSPGQAFQLISVVEGVRAMAFYSGLLLFPFPHRPFLDTIPESALTTAFSFGGLFLIVGGLIYALSRRHLVLGVGFFWALVFLLPPVAVGILKVPDAPFAERYVYPSSVGFLAGFVVLYHWAWVWLKSPFSVYVRRSFLISASFAGVALIFLGWTGAKRNAVWKDTETFWSAAAKASPNAVSPHEQLGIVFGRKNKFPEAEAEFRLALNQAVAPHRRARVLSNQGNLFSRMGRFDEARSALAMSVELRPNNDEVLWHLAELYFLSSIVEEETVDGESRVSSYNEVLFIKGEGYLERALDLNPLLPLLWEAGKTYERFQKPENALKYYRRILSVTGSAQTELVRNVKERLEVLSIVEGKIQ